MHPLNPIVDHSFAYCMIHPCDEGLTAWESLAAIVTSVALGILTLGLLHVWACMTAEPPLEQGVIGHQSQPQLAQTEPEREKNLLDQLLEQRRFVSRQLDIRAKETLDSGVVLPDDTVLLRERTVLFQFSNNSVGKITIPRKEDAAKIFCEDGTLDRVKQVWAEAWEEVRVGQNDGPNLQKYRSIVNEWHCKIYTTHGMVVNAEG